MNKISKNSRNRKNNRGTTLVEMIVAFALLAVFLASAASIIGTVSTMYYQIKSETYSKQVSDIILEKLSSEISGAMYFTHTDIGNPIILDEEGEISETGIGKTIELYDKTNTHISISADTDAGILLLHYYEIDISHKIDDELVEINYGEKNWGFQDSIYNEYRIADLTFVRGDSLGDFTEIGKYGLSSSGSYGNDVIVVFLKLHSTKYEDYYTYRFIKMYNVPAAPTTGQNE